MTTKYLYFGKLDGMGGAYVDNSTEGYLASPSKLVCVAPQGGSATVAYFESGRTSPGDDPAYDQIYFLHDQAQTTTGHYCKLISRAIARACNATSESGIVVMYDEETQTYYDGLKEIKQQSSLFMMIITLHNHMIDGGSI